VLEDSCEIKTVRRIQIRYKLVILFFVLYLPFLGAMLYVYSGSPPNIDVTFYKGAPIGTGKEWSNVTQKGKADDLNIVRTTMAWFVDNEGNLHDLFFMKPLIIEHIQHAHRLGFKVYVSLRFQYGLGAPRNIPDNIRSIAFTHAKQKVQEWAEICEKYGVELYAPIQECEMLGSMHWDDEDSGNQFLSGDEEISEWIQDVLPLIKERYSGFVVCGGGAWGGSSPEFWKMILDNCEIDFTGYDYITFGPYPYHLKHLDDITMEAYREYIRYSLDKLNEWAERDGCKGVIIREMGGPTEFIQVVLEEGENTLKGIITTHYHWDDYPMVSYWFRERLP